MKKWRLSVSAFLLAAVSSTAAFAAVHYFEVIGEAYGHTSEEAIDNALRYANDECYRRWGRADQEFTVLAEWVDPVSGYPYARVSLGCRTED